MPGTWISSDGWVSSEPTWSDGCSESVDKGIKRRHDVYMTKQERLQQERRYYERLLTTAATLGEKHVDAVRQTIAEIDAQIVGA